MRDLFPQDNTELKDAPEPPDSNGSAAQQIRESLEGKHICPFCGAQGDAAEGACENCAMENSPAARKATKSRVGPWFVLQNRNPAAPGMKFETLLAFVHKGRVKPNSVVRGPTTHQLWRFAAHVKGVSREFGLCYSCGEQIPVSANVCPQCNRLQSPPANPDSLLESAEHEAAPPVARAPIYRELPPASGRDADIVVPAFGKGRAPVQAATDLAGPELPASPSSSRRNSVRDDRTRPSPAPLFAAGASKPDRTRVAPASSAPKSEPPGRAPDSPLPAAAPLRPLAGLSGPPRRDGAAPKIIFGAIVLAALTYGGLLYADPPLRQQPLAVINQVRESMSRWWGPKSTTADTTVRKTPEPVRPRPVVQTPTPPPAAAPPVPEPAPVPAAPAPVTVSPMPLKPDPAPAPVVSKPAPPAPEPAAPAPSNDPTDDYNLSIHLYRSAIDAEGANDFPKAVSLYEQIKKLPREVWPQDLDLRLRVAREQAR